jgi:hypothetical protein
MKTALTQDKTPRKRENARRSKDGRSTRIRTLDPLVPNQVRYQTAPHSEDLNYKRACGEISERRATLIREAAFRCR